MSEAQGDCNEGGLPLTFRNTRWVVEWKGRGRSQKYYKERCIYRNAKKKEMRDIRCLPEWREITVAKTTDSWRRHGQKDCATGELGKVPSQAEVPVDFGCAQVSVASRGRCP